MQFLNISLFSIIQCQDYYPQGTDGKNKEKGDEVGCFWSCRHKLNSSTVGKGRDFLPSSVYRKKYIPVIWIQLSVISYYASTVNVLSPSPYRIRKCTFLGHRTHDQNLPKLSDNSKVGVNENTSYDHIYILVNYNPGLIQCFLHCLHS